MNNSEISKRDKYNGEIALFCGWEFDKNQYRQWISPNGTGFAYPPAYNRDLNQMHEAEEHLSTEEIKTYMGHLLDIMGISVWCITHVSAAERAEAFLKTIGKWEE